MYPLSIDDALIFHKASQYQCPTSPDSFILRIMSLNLLYHGLIRVNCIPEYTVGLSNGAG